MKQKKRFSCVAMKRREALKVWEETRGMTREEELAYWAESARQLKELKESQTRRKAGE